MQYVLPLNNFSGSEHEFTMTTLNLIDRLEALLIGTICPDQIQLETVDDIQIPKSYSTAKCTLAGGGLLICFSY